jgi:alkanesulfonate monooxygenase SsuD/methylene tetrahydromethanopterin reductase-like flavin-dependent oxidoreductase (luciferase family)
MRHRLRLGLFGTNASNGICFSDPPDVTETTWASTVAIARLADEIGFDLLVPLARWKGFGGRINVNATVFETFTWAAGLAAQTSQITIVATCHAPAVHPVAAAKQAVTVDHISGGRFALNLVMGWFEPELAMFGITPVEHDERYRYGEEWLTIVSRLWKEAEPFDFHGRYFDGSGLEALPKPVRAGGPLIINAGSSPAGVQFSAKNADLNFMPIFSIESAGKHAFDIKQLAGQYGRSVEVFSYSTVICADTEAEANARYDEIIEHADWEGTENFMRFIGLNSGSFGDQLREAQERFVTCTGGYPLIGTPAQVAEQLIAISDSGVDGMVFGVLDHRRELPYFAERVLPLLKTAGVR